MQFKMEVLSSTGAAQRGQISVMAEGSFGQRCSRVSSGPKQPLFPTSMSPTVLCKSPWALVKVPRVTQQVCGGA